MWTLYCSQQSQSVCYSGLSPCTTVQASGSGYLRGFLTENPGSVWRWRKISDITPPPQTQQTTDVLTQQTYSHWAEKMKFYCPTLTNQWKPTIGNITMHTNRAPQANRWMLVVVCAGKNGRLLPLTKQWKATIGNNTVHTNRVLQANTRMLFMRGTSSTVHTPPLSSILWTPRAVA